MKLEVADPRLKWVGLEWLWDKYISVLQLQTFPEEFLGRAVLSLEMVVLTFEASVLSLEMSVLNQEDSERVLEH